MLNERSIHGTATHWSCPSTCEGKCLTQTHTHTHTDWHTHTHTDWHTHTHTYCFFGKLTFTRHSATYLVVPIMHIHTLKDQSFVYNTHIGV